MQRIEEVFQAHLPQELNQQGVILAREDGQILYDKIRKDLDSEKQSIGALSGGMWQAANALMNLMSVTKTTDLMRLSFDSSSSGVYLLPIEKSSESYFLVLIFNNVVNPGLLKNKLRLFHSVLMDWFEEMEDIPVGQRKTLFENITDDEMDQMFGVIGV